VKGASGSTDYIELARAVLQLSRHLTRTFDEALGPAYGLATKDYLVLRVVASGEVHPGGVAAHLNMPPASVSRVLERLESKGYLGRSVDPADHRRFILAVTPEGERTADAIRGLMRQVLGKTYAHVPAKALRAAVEHLSVLNEVIDKRS
jgi:DNA-binding MarR family transcriptional regulator